MGLLADNLKQMLAREKQQKPPVLVNPLIVKDYTPYISGDTAIINANGGDLLLYCHEVNGKKTVLMNTTIYPYNYRNLIVYGLDLQCDNGTTPASRMLLLRGDSAEGVQAEAIENIFIQGLHINSNYGHGNLDAISCYWVGSKASPVERLVIQDSLINGIGIAGDDDVNGFHPDIFQLQGDAYIKDIYFENFTGKTMYQGIYAPWEENTGTPADSIYSPRWHFADANFVSEDPSTHIMLSLANIACTVADYPKVTFTRTYISQGQTHEFGVGCTAIHVDPDLTDASPYEFVSGARINGVPFPGLAPNDFVTRNEVGVYY